MNINPVLVAIFGEVTLVAFVLFMAFYTTRKTSKKSSQISHRISRK